MAAKTDKFSGTRLEVGLSVLDKPRTLYEIAKLQGKPSGSVQGLVRRMVDDSLLVADSDPPTRGTLYEVHEDAREALLDAASGFQSPGTLTEHQRLLNVSGKPGRIEAMKLLTSTTLAGAVSWVARTNSTDDLLVAMNPSADDVLVDALVIAFSEAGFAIREGLVAQIMSAEEMREQNKRANARARAASE